MSKILGPDGRPIGAGGEILLPEHMARKKLTPEQYISRIIRRVEGARRVGDDELASMLVLLATQGWRVCEDKALQTHRVGVTMVTHLQKDVHGQLQAIEERILRVGAAFMPVLKMLSEEQAKAAEKNAEEAAKLEENLARLRKEMGADFDPAEEQDPLDGAEQRKVGS